MLPAERQGCTLVSRKERVLTRWLQTHAPERPSGVARDAIVRELRVPPEAQGMRLDVFLSATLRNTSRTKAKQIAAHSAYTRAGRRLRPSERLCAEQHVALWRLPVDDLPPEARVPILYQDAHLLAVDKPANLAVHPTARHFHATVTHVLGACFPDERLTLIHRLDRETSGVLLVARTAAADRAFKLLFERRSPAFEGLPATAPIEKVYIAVVHGILQPPFMHDAPAPGLAPREWLIEQAIEPDPDNSLRVKMRVSSRSTALQARTLVLVLAAAAGYSVVRCRLLTGRQHQIRVHLSHLGHPVVGDKLYGSDDRLLARAADGQLTPSDLVSLELPRHALHALRYRLPHALTHEPLAVTAPVPDDLRSFWERRTGTAFPTEHLGAALAPALHA